MRVVRDVLGELTLDGESQDETGEPGEFLTEEEEDTRGEDPVDALHLAEPAGREESAEEIAAVRKGQNVGRTALEHGDLGGLFGDLGKEGDGGRTTADNHHRLVVVVEILGPELRVDGLALEVAQSRDGALQGLIVVVVSGTENDEARGVGLGLALVVDIQGPDIIGAGPVGGDEFVLEMNMVVDAVLVGGVAHVLGDRAALRDRIVLVPGMPGEAKGEQVRIRADARVAKEVPGPADSITGFQESIAVARKLTLNPIGSVDTGDTGADDDDVEAIVREAGCMSVGVAVHDDQR